MTSARFTRRDPISKFPGSGGSPNALRHLRAAGLGDLIEPGKHVLWVASCGGHLAELKKMAELYEDLGVDSQWVTFDTPQSRSMLEGASVSYVPRIGTRDGAGTLRALATAYRILRGRPFDYVVSTGAAVAAAFLPMAAMFGMEAIYVESLTRTQGASMTGRILQRFPALRMYTQYESWADSRWQYAGSILDTWEAGPGPHREVQRILVSLGTIRPYRFDRAVDAVLAARPDGSLVTWQLGATIRPDLPGVSHEELAWADLGRMIRESDVFVCHAGVGSVLQALDNGVVPVLAVRSARYGEHVDNHQALFAEEMVRRGLGKVLDSSEAGKAVLQQAAALVPRRHSAGANTGPVDANPFRPAAGPVIRPAHRLSPAAKSPHQIPARVSR